MFFLCIFTADLILFAVFVRCKMELSSSSFKHQMKSVEKRHQQNLINHHLPIIAITNSENKQNSIHKKAQSRKLLQQQQPPQEKHRPSSNGLVNQQLLPAASNFAPQSFNNEQHHNTGLVAKSPVSFPVYELALPATLLAFIIFGILFILGFIIYKLLKHFCRGHKHKRRLTKDNIYYQTVRNKHAAATPTKTNTLFYRYRFTPKKNIASGMDDGLLDEEDVYATNVGSIITVNEESKCKKSPPPSPYVEDEMRTPEAHFSSNPNSPSFIVSIPQYSDEINSNLNTQDRSALQFLHGDIHYVQPIMIGSTRQADEQQVASSPYISEELAAADCDNLNKVKQLSRDQNSPRQATDSSASSPLFTACEIISGSTLGSASRFSFSPKNLKELSASPLLPSAGLKHGNYFKFPEVDIFTPTNKANNNNEEEEDKEVGKKL